MIKWWFVTIYPFITISAHILILIILCPHTCLICTSGYDIIFGQNIPSVSDRLALLYWPTEPRRDAGATLQEDFQACVILCSQFEWWCDYGKTNNPVLCSGTGCILCVILHVIVSFDSFQSALRFFPSLFPHSRHAQMFSCSSKEDVQSSKRNG